MPQAQESWSFSPVCLRSMVELGALPCTGGAPRSLAGPRAVWLWAAPLWELGESGWVWGLTGGWEGLQGLSLAPARPACTCVQGALLTTPWSGRCPRPLPVPHPHLAHLPGQPLGPPRGELSGPRYFQVGPEFRIRASTSIHVCTPIQDTNVSSPCTWLRPVCPPLPSTPPHLGPSLGSGLS